VKETLKLGNKKAGGLLISRGWSCLPQIIMERLGHTNDRTTRNIYLHVTKTMKKEASQKFAQLMDNL
jgi:integrase